ncbi:hypothetical protein [uncultured Sphingomonas sp.]|uniref:hypothetical protein n=1 Tax=uncultured Sphingomonas sp. TaxID=158754 RepID=UPI00261E7150|nr:hypothetical protein [uncultured Sphingomonas sp.]
MAIEFWILLAIALGLTARSMRNLLTARFPSLIDFATLSTVYYSVPLAALGFLSINPRGLAFLHPAAADPGLALMSMRYAVLALLGMEGGRIIAGLRRTPLFVLSFRLNTGTETRAMLWFMVLFALFPLGVYFFGVAEFFSGYASEYYSPIATLGNAIIYSSIEAFGFAILLALILGERSGRVPLKMFIAVALTILVFALAVRAKRLEVVSALLPAGVLLAASRDWLRKPASRAALVGGGMLVLILVSVLRVSDSFSWFNLLYYTFTEGIYAGHSLPGIEERLQTLTIGHEYGARFLTAGLAFVPRFLWEGKDALVYQGNLALQGVSPLGATSFLAEVVLQGGMVAVVIVYGLLGFLFQRMMSFEPAWDRGVKAGIVPLRFGAYIVALVIFIPHWRDGIIPAVKLSAQSIVAFLLITGFHYQAGYRRKIESGTGSALP